MEGRNGHGVYKGSESSRRLRATLLGVSMLSELTTKDANSVGLELALGACTLRDTLLSDSFVRSPYIKP